MNHIKLFILAFVFFCFSTTFGQEKRQIDSAAESVNNPVKTKIAANGSFKQPITIDIFSSKEKDNQNRAVVNGLTVKGVIVSSAVSSVGNLAGAGGAGGGAAAASYAATGRAANGNIKITISQPETGDEACTFADEKGDFSVTLKHDTLHTIYVNGVEYGQIKLKTKHDTAKNSISNIR